MEIKVTGNGFGIIVPIFLTIVGGAFYLGFTIKSSQVEHLQSLVSEYQRSGNLDAPGLVSSLNQSAKALSLSASERKSYETTKERVEEYAERIGVCEANRKESDDKVVKITEELATYKQQCNIQVAKLKEELNAFLPESKTITVHKGGAVDLIPNKVMLGITSIYENRAVFSINGTDVFLHLGENYSVRSVHSTCEVWLTKIAPSRDQLDVKVVCAR